MMKLVQVQALLQTIFRTGLILDRALCKGNGLYLSLCLGWLIYLYIGNTYQAKSLQRLHVVSFSISLDWKTVYKKYYNVLYNMIYKVLFLLLLAVTYFIVDIPWDINSLTWFGGTKLPYQESNWGYMYRD